MPFTVNDTIVPDDSPATLAGAINAIAHQIKTITGASSWKTTPPTSIQAISNFGSGQNAVFESSGTINSINDIAEFRNGGSKLKVQAQRTLQATDLYHFNWFPDNGLNPSLTPGGLYFGYEAGSARLALNDAGLVFNKNNQFISGIEMGDNQVRLYIPEFNGIEVFAYGRDRHIFNFSPYSGLKLFGFGGGGTLVDVGENTGCTLRNYNASASGLTVYASANQSADLVQFKSATGATKLSISSDIKIDFPATTNAPADTTVPIGWVEIKINGEMVYIPAYR